MSDEANDERMCECECVESMHNKLVIIFKQQLKTQKANTPFRWRQWPFSFQNPVSVSLLTFITLC